MKINRRMRNLAIETFKTINNLDLCSVKEIFATKANPMVRPNNIAIKSCSTATYGDKSLTTLGPKICNFSPENINSESSYSRFKKCINIWFGPQRYCSYCRNLTTKT